MSNPKSRSRSKSSSSSSNVADISNKEPYLNRNHPVVMVLQQHPNHVLFGHRRGTNHHPGNMRFRKMLEDRKQQYIIETSCRKLKLANDSSNVMMMMVHCVMWETKRLVKRWVNPSKKWLVTCHVVTWMKMTGWVAYMARSNNIQEAQMVQQTQQTIVICTTKKPCCSGSYYLCHYRSGAAHLSYTTNVYPKSF